MTEQRIDQAKKQFPTGLFITLVIAWFGWAGLQIFRFGYPEAWDSSGQFGDTFGALNALFTALAFGAVWWTGRMQSEDLKLQYQELRAQRQELADTRAVHTKQTFEATFFRMIELLRQAEYGISVHTTGSNELLFGQRALAVIAKNIVRRVTSERANSTDGSAILSKIAEDTYRSYEGALGPYFRSLYHLFKFLDAQSNMTEQDRITYANMARAQLSKDALMLLAANGCNAGLAKEMIPLITKYRLLKHLPRDGFFEIVERCYPKETFTGRERYHT